MIKIDVLPCSIIILVEFVKWPFLESNDVGRKSYFADS